MPPDLIRGWMPVRVRKTRQSKKNKLFSGRFGLSAPSAVRRRPPGYAGQEGEAWWTGLPGLTINPRSQAAPRVGSAQVAQLVEHATENRSVGGSIPPLGTISSLRCAPGFLIVP